MLSTSATHLIIARTQNYGDGFRALQLLEKDTFEVLEFFPVGQGGHLIIEILEDAAIDAEKEFAAWKQQAEAQKIQFLEIYLFTFLENQIIDAYLSLNVPALTKDLLILESESLIEMIKLSRQLLSKNAQIFDLRFLKGSQPKAICIINQVSEVPVSTDKVHVTHVTNINSHVQNFLQSTGRLHQI